LGKAFLIDNVPVVVIVEKNDDPLKGLGFGCKKIFFTLSILNISNIFILSLLKDFFKISQR
jgi:hypothetical protein